METSTIPSCTAAPYLTEIGKEHISTKHEHMTEGGGKELGLGRRPLPHHLQFAIFPHGPTRSPNRRSQEQCLFCGCKQSPLINSKPSRLNCISGRHQVVEIRCVDGRRYVVNSIPSPSLRILYQRSISCASPMAQLSTPKFPNDQQSSPYTLWPRSAQSCCALGG